MPFTIRNLEAEELKIPLEWAEKEGWNPGLHDWETFFAADPKGFFIGELDGEPIAAVSAVVYDERFAFCGLYIVKPECRGKGYGMAVTEFSLKYAGERITGGDGVIANIPLYERIGYVPVHKSMRYQLKDASLISKAAGQLPEVLPLKHVPFAEVERFDLLHFPAPRSRFLQQWISQAGSQAFGWVEDNRLHGYGVIRPCAVGYKIGPLFAESGAIAKVLFKTLVSSVSAYPIFLDIPEPNTAARQLVQNFGMQPTFEVMRIYRNGLPDLNLNQIFGFTTFELG